MLFRSEGNGVNNVLFSSSVYGAAWGNRILGLTLQRYDPRSNRYSESDILFNSGVRWDSYRGALRTQGGENVAEFRRVALHELGHSLGLNHPDDAGQSDHLVDVLGVVPRVEFFFALGGDVEPDGDECLCFGHFRIED